MNPISPGNIDILAVDDRPDNLKLLKDMLQERGYGIRAATNGELALESVRHALPDVVLLDINMPGMDGYEVCRRLKEIPGFGETPVIFVSALSEMDNIVDAFRNGGVDYVTKPYKLEEIEQRMQTQLELCRLRKMEKNNPGLQITEGYLEEKSGGN